MKQWSYVSYFLLVVNSVISQQIKTYKPSISTGHHCDGDYGSGGCNEIFYLNYSKDTLNYTGDTLKSIKKTSIEFKECTCCPGILDPKSKYEEEKALYTVVKKEIDMPLSNFHIEGTGYVETYTVLNSKTNEMFTFYIFKLSTYPKSIKPLFEIAPTENGPIPIVSSCEFIMYYSVNE